MVGGVFASLFDELVLSDRARQRGIFQVDEIEQMVREHRRGTVDHTERLWALFNTEIWFRRCIEGENLSF